MQRIREVPGVRTFLPHVAPSQSPADDHEQNPEILLLPCPDHESGSLSAKHMQMWYASKSCNIHYQIYLRPLKARKEFSANKSISSAQSLLKACSQWPLLIVACITPHSNDLSNSMLAYCQIWYKQLIGKK